MAMRDAAHGVAAPPRRTIAAGGVPAAGLFIAATAAVLFLAFFWGRQVGPDIAWYLIATRQWLAGAQLYVDLVEVNPPLNFYLTVPPVLLADAAGMTLPNAQFVVVALLLGLSLAWSARILAGAAWISPGRQNGFLAGVALALVIPALGEIGQREHLMLLLVTPWLIGELVADGGRGPRSVPRAAVAAIGICIKPFFLVYPVAVTLWHMYRSWSFRPILAPGNIAMVAVGAAYLGLVAARHPEYLRDIVPLAVAVYGDYRLPPAVVLGSMQPLAIACFAAIGMIAFALRAVPPRMGFWWLLVAAAIAAYLVQAAGFPYHAVPIFAFVVMGYAWMLAMAWPGPRPGALAAAGLIATLPSFVVTGPYRYDVTRTLAAAVTAHAPSPRLAVLSTVLLIGPPTAIEADAEWVGRYPALWLVPGAVNGLARADCAIEAARCAKLAAIRDRTRRDIVTDLVDGRPDVIVLDTFYALIDAPGFTWDGFLAGDPRYPALRASYRQVDDLGGLVILARTGS